MMKRLGVWLLLLALALVMAPCALAQEDDHDHLDEDGVLIENPVHDVTTLEELAEAVPGVDMPALPEDADGIVYSYIHAEPLIAQIHFRWGEHAYALRAAKLPKDMKARDIDGLYLPFDVIEEFTNLFEGYEDLLVVKSSAGEAYAVCDWTHAAAGTQYALFSETGGEPEMPIIELAALLMGANTGWTIGNE